MPGARDQFGDALRMASRFGGLDASLMARSKEPEDENRRLKQMCADEHIKAEIVQDALLECGEAILPTLDGPIDRKTAWHQQSAGVRCSGFQPGLLPLKNQAVGRERRDR